MSTTHNIQAEKSSALIRGLDLAVKILIRLSIFLGAAAALGMVVNVFLDVAMRFGMNTPIQGTNQFVSFWWMLPLVFFGLAAAQHYGEHTDLPIVYERLNPWGRQIMAIVALCFTGIFVSLIGWSGFTNALEQMAVGEYDSSTGITVWPPRFAVPLACLAFLLVIVAHILQLLINRDAVLSAEQEAVGEEADVLADLENQNIMVSEGTDNLRAPERTVAK
ncbi:TRAP transporter small permease [Corynebacterium comes]|uniref:Tripartite ATP-independent periplasmic transporter, DctQ component n=1 Tax=Corynebacterium comes TaxID=2675218 RepID=A0A6B8VWR5_9CORY|nr:TRAP transporter small permease [Corynebacterium comes]QGU04157.1 Tripartite ATP-independent periplasmic transporter, DctQ component [Corynebacterium comes]